MPADFCPVTNHQANASMSGYFLDTTDVTDARTSSGSTVCKKHILYVVESTTNQNEKYI